jgi:hypothetical protein
MAESEDSRPNDTLRLPALLVAQGKLSFFKSIRFSDSKAAELHALMIADNCCGDPGCRMAVVVGKWF